MIKRVSHLTCTELFKLQRDTVHSVALLTSYLILGISPAETKPHALFKYSAANQSDHLEHTAQNAAMKRILKFCAGVRFIYSCILIHTQKLYKMTSYPTLNVHLHFRNTFTLIWS